MDNYFVGGNSSSIPMPYSVPYANRGLGGDLFFADEIAKEDWLRNEQSAEIAFNRESQFNALEAQKNREFNAKQAELAYQRDREARQTQYQDMIQSLKEAGLNPALAYSSSGGSISAPSSSGSSASTGGRQGNSGQGFSADSVGFLGSLITGALGLINSGVTRKTMLDISKDNNTTKLNIAYLNRNKKNK